MHELVAEHFSRLDGWEIAPEVSYSIWGERGVIDLLAWHAATRTLLVIELKTEIVDINELMGKADQRRRLAPEIAAARGWVPHTVGVWIVVADSRTNRRRLAAHRSVLRVAFPTDGRTMPGWLRRPSGRVAALSFLSNRHETGVRKPLAAVRRVVVPRSRCGPPPDRDTGRTPR